MKTTYERIETTAKVPANYRVYLARDERTNHDRLRQRAQVLQIIAAPKPAGVEALRQAFKRARVDALVCRDQGPTRREFKRIGARVGLIHPISGQLCNEIDL